MLVTMKEILDRAHAENYAVLAPNIFSELDGRTCLEAAEEENAPIILDVSPQPSPDLVFVGGYLAKLAEQARVPVALNLDHGQTFDQAILGIRAGFTSIMVDRSKLPYEQNLREVKELTRIAHSIGLSVEAELGHVGTGKDYHLEGKKMMTDPEQAAEYIKETGIDCLAVAIGTAHGAYVGKPHIDFERLKEIKSRVNFPLVLHGGSGTGDENIAKACRMGINKVNVSNELLRRMRDAIVEKDFSGDKIYDLWKLMTNTLRDRVKELIRLCGSDQKAWTKEREGLPRTDRSMRE